MHRVILSFCLILTFTSFSTCFTPVIETFEESSWVNRWGFPEDHDIPDWTCSEQRFDKSLDANTPRKTLIAGHWFSSYLYDPSQGPLVLQFEVKFQGEITAGRATTKLYRDQDIKDRVLDKNTPYVVEYGVDFTSGTLILNILLWSPISNSFEQKNYTASVSFPKDSLWHLYTLYMRKDLIFYFYIDGEEVHKGVAAEGFSPSIYPSPFITDPDDTPPKGWNGPYDDVDSQPLMIPDPKVVKPKDWDEEAEEYIPLLTATKPEEWDEEVDGEWSPPLEKNPACESHGCGPFKAPLIPNPKAWKPQMIENPDYYLVSEPFDFALVSGIGFEAYFEGSGKIKFDNLYLGYNITLAREIQNKTFDIKNMIQNKELRGKAKIEVPEEVVENRKKENRKKKRKEQSLEDLVLSFFSLENFYVFAAVICVFPVVYLVCFSKSAKNPDQQKTEKAHNPTKSTKEETKHNQPTKSTKGKPNSPNKQNKLKKRQ